MIEALIFWAILIFVIYRVRKFFKENNLNEDLTYGDKQILNIVNLIEKNDFISTEKNLLDLDEIKFTQAIDCITLKFNEDKFQFWNSKSDKSDLLNLILGVFHLHQAWISRTHVFASKVSDKRKLDFFGHQEISKKYFDEINDNFEFIKEKYSRLIRWSMGENGYSHDIEIYFSKAKNNSKNLWPYIHYCEVIQPKWGGSNEKIISFLSQLPNDLAVKNTIKLKLILDSFVISENYFESLNSNLLDFAKKELIRVDEEISENEINTINKFLLFNYMKEISKQVKNKSLYKKYLKLSNRYHTLYPYGVIL